MLKFHCDGCGEEMQREDAWQIALFEKAYVPEKEQSEEHRGELCPTCARNLLKNLLCKGAEEVCEAVAVSPMGGGRCITLARVRAGLSQTELSEKLFYSGSVVSAWELGKREPPWEELEQSLPELAEIRRKGCAAYCDKGAECDDGKCCIYASKTAVRHAKRHEER